MEVLYEFERWLGTWMSPDSFLEPRWVSENGSRAEAPDELSSWTCGPWDYATISSEFRNAGRQLITEPTKSSMVRRRKWTCPRVATSAPTGSSVGNSSGSNAESASSFTYSHQEATVRGTWQNDSDAASCACGKKFGFREKRHHCRECGAIFCGKCTTRAKILLRSTAGAAEVCRVCDVCFAAPRGALAIPGAAASQIKLLSRSVVVALISACGSRAPSRSSREAAMAIAAALAVEIDSNAAAAPSSAIDASRLGVDLLERADVFASVARILVKRRVWDARALSVMKAAAAAAGVPFAFITRLYHLTISLAERGRDSNVDAAGVLRQTLNDLKSTTPGVGSGGSLMRSAWAVPLGLAVVATGGGAALGLASLSLGSAAVFHGLVAFKTVSLLAASGSAATAPHAAAATKGLEEITFECLSHESLMSMRARRALAASRERNGSAAGSLSTGAHNADLNGVTICISGLSFSSSVDRSADPSQNLLVDFAAPWGGVENADATVTPAWKEKESGEVTPGWWGRARASTHSGELWTLFWGWSALAALDKQLERVKSWSATSVGEALLVSAAAAATVLNALKVHETPMMRALREADQAGILLAHALLTGTHGASEAGRRPVSLIGIGLGARVAFSAAREIGRVAADLSAAAGAPLSDGAARWPAVPPSRDDVPAAGVDPSSIILDVVLLTPLVDASLDEWRLVRSASSGRVIVAFSTDNTLLLGAEKIGLLNAPLCAGLRPLGGNSATPFAFDGDDGSVVASMWEGIESWDVSRIAPLHSDVRKRVPSILEHMGYCVGIETDVLFEDTSLTTEPASSPLSWSPLTSAPGETLYGLLQLKKLLSLFETYKLVVNRMVLGVHSPDYVAAAPIIVALKQGCSALLTRFHGARIVRELLEQLDAHNTALCNTAVDDAHSLGFFDPRSAVPWNEADSPPALLSESTLAEIRAAVMCVDAAGTSSRSAYIACFVSSQMAPLASKKFTNPQRSTVCDAAAAAALSFFPSRFAWLKRARAHAVAQFDSLWPRNWNVDTALVRGFLEISRDDATFILSMLLNTHQDLLSTALRESRIFEIRELDGKLHDDDEMLVGELKNGMLSSLFGAALSPEIPSELPAKPAFFGLLHRK